MLALKSPALLTSRLCKSLTYLSPPQRTVISGSKPLFYRTRSAISSNPLLSTEHTGRRTYTIEHVLQEEVSPPRQVRVDGEPSHVYMLIPHSGRTVTTSY